MDKFKLRNLPKCVVNLESAVDQINTTNACSLVSVDELLEAGRYPFITPVLNEIVKNLDGIKHHSQRQMRDGDTARGNPDWTLVHEDLNLPIFVIEGKVSIGRAGIAQVVLQLYKAYKKMRPEGYNEPWVMYGMLTNAIEVVFVKALFHGEQCKGVWRTRVFKIPHHKGMTVDAYTGSVTPVIQYVVAMVNRQIAQLKKARNEQA
jgi:hypothetical protein